MRLLSRLAPKQPQEQPGPIQPESIGLAPQYITGGLPQPRPTKDERYLQLLLGSGLPKDRPHIDKHWLIASEANRHSQLTNFSDRAEFHRYKMMLTDQMRVGGWDAPEYFDELSLRRYGIILGQKSISYTKVPRERDALNEDRHTTVVRDDRTPIPRESHGIMAGMFSR